jgi:aquaporin Z
MSGRHHWTEYLIESASLGLFMVSALLVTAFVEHPDSPLRHLVPLAALRRALTGIAMGSTAAALTYSRWGQRSGAHLNPSVTISFLRLGKITARDAVFYVLAQFTGAALGLLLVSSVLHRVVGHPAVNYVATLPGPLGVSAAFAGELTISFVMMATILLISNSPYARYTGVVAASLVALYITVEAPLSGMSMNPARSLAPAVASQNLAPLWIYFTAPLAGMLLAAEIYLRRFGPAAIRCAKLQHPAGGPCHFGCASV